MGVTDAAYAALPTMGQGVATARQSVMVARLGADLRGGWRQSVRNSLMHLIPVAPALRAGAPTVRWTPPS